MAWTDLVTPLIRGMIGDNSLSETYTDTQIQQGFLVGGFIVQNEATFAAVYMIDVTNVTISPDPTILPDIAFINLACMKAAQQIFNGEMRLYANQGIKLKDGPSELDLRRDSRGLADIYKSFTDQYNTAIKIYRMNQSIGATVAFVSGHLRGIRYNTSDSCDWGWGNGDCDWGFWNGVYGIGC
jgi:hypothetical protein